MGCGESNVGGKRRGEKDYRRGRRGAAEVAERNRIWFCWGFWKKAKRRGEKEEGARSEGLAPLLAC